MIGFLTKILKASNSRPNADLAFLVYREYALINLKVGEQMEFMVTTKKDPERGCVFKSHIVEEINKKGDELFVITCSSIYVFDLKGGYNSV